jgi:hypothetical protein
MDGFADKAHRLRNIVLRAYGRVLLAALMDIFADRSILACTEVALMDNFVDKSTLASTALALMDNCANKPTTYATLCCVLNGVYYMRPHGHFRRPVHIGVYCSRPHGQFRRQAHHPRNIVLRANWRLLHAVLMDNFADRSSTLCWCWCCWTALERA